METSIPQPDTIDKLRFAADAAFAMLAGMQLDVFTPLRAGSKSAEEIASAIVLCPARLRLPHRAGRCGLRDGVVGPPGQVHT